MTRHSGPSTLWTRLLRGVVPSRDCESVTAELAELYRVRVERWGRVPADRWYRTEVFAYVVTLRWNRADASARRPWPGMRERGLDNLRRDVIRAGRSLIRNPGFTIVAVLTLTLGIGANTLIFSVVDHIALRPLPYSQPDDLVAVWPDQYMVRGELDIIENDNTSFASIGGFLRTDGFNLEMDGASHRVQGHFVSPGLLQTLGVQPVLGRNFRPDESMPGTDDVVLLSHGMWRDLYGSDPDVIGRTIILDGRQREVVGIMPPRFGFPDAAQDIVLPLANNAQDVGNFWGFGGQEAIARLRPGISTDVATAELRALSAKMREANPLWTPVEGYRNEARVVPMRAAIVGEITPTLLVLLGAVGLVLLVACANVSNLLLARGLARGRDVAVRAALGASRTRLIREHIIESLLLAAVGTTVALLIAQWALGIVVSFLPPEIPRVEEITLDLRVIGVGVVLALVTGLLAGLLPALRSSGTDPAAALSEGGRGTGRGGGRRQRRLSSALVVAQIALAVVLVTGAGLLLRSLGALGRVDSGFEPIGVTTARLTLGGVGYENGLSRYQFYQSVTDRMLAVPGVESVGIGRRIPFGPGTGSIATFIDGVTEDPNDLPMLNRNQIMPEFLATLGVPLLEGRRLQTSDGPEAPLVALIDQTAAERFWPGTSALGRRIRYPWRGAPWIEVVGIVGGTLDGNLATERQPAFYVPLAQDVSEDATLVVRSTQVGGLVASAIRDVVRGVDGRIPVSAVTTMPALIALSAARARWTAILLSMFAGLTLLLGSVGVYGVVAYSVRARTQEFGVRMALGADPNRIRSAVLWDGLRLAVPGTAMGMLLAVPTARLLDGLLFGVTPLDPLTFGAVPVVLIISAAVAVYLPARRATEVDPMEALRAEI